MPSLDLVTRFIISFLDSICTIYISSYSMENNQSIIHFCQFLHGIKLSLDLDYHDTFNPVVKPTIVHLVLSLAISHE